MRVAVGVLELDHEIKLNVESSEPIYNVEVGYPVTYTAEVAK